MQRVIQQATLKELPKVAEAFAPPPYNKPLSLFEEYFEEQQKEAREIYLALLDGKVIGYATIVWESPYPPFSEARIPEVKDLNVLVEHRCRGCGTDLIKHLEKRALVRGYKVIGIGVGVTLDYGAAQSLYRSLGYVPDGRGIYPDEWGGATYFTKSLS